jgi:hypothetical protein
VCVPQNREAQLAQIGAGAAVQNFVVPFMGTEAGGVGAEELREPWRKNPETASEAVVGFNLRKALANRVVGAVLAEKPCRPRGSGGVVPPQIRRHGAYQVLNEGGSPSRVEGRQAVLLEKLRDALTGGVPCCSHPAAGEAVHGALLGVAAARADSSFGCLCVAWPDAAVGGVGLTGASLEKEELETVVP